MDDVLNYVEFTDTIRSTARWRCTELFAGLGAKNARRQATQHRSGPPTEPNWSFAQCLPTVARWQVPDRWVRVEQIPRTGDGKIDKQLLRSRYATEQPLAAR